MRILFVFDFDHTIIQENADVKILEAFADFNPAPNKYVLFSFLSLPHFFFANIYIVTLFFRKMYKEEGWAAYMNNIFEIFQANGVRQEEFEKVLSTIELTPGMKELFEYISQNPRIFECIIASDSNYWFIGKPARRGNWKLLTLESFLILAILYASPSYPQSLFYCYLPQSSC